MADSVQFEKADAWLPWGRIEAGEVNPIVTDTYHAQPASPNVAKPAAFDPNPSEEVRCVDRSADGKILIVYTVDGIYGYGIGDAP